MTKTRWGKRWRERVGWNGRNFEGGRPEGSKNMCAQ